MAEFYDLKISIETNCKCDASFTDTFNNCWRQLGYQDDFIGEGSHRAASATEHSIFDQMEMLEINFYTSGDFDDILLVPGHILTTLINTIEYLNLTDKDRRQYLTYHKWFNLSDTRYNNHDIINESLIGGISPIFKVYHYATKGGARTYAHESYLFLPVHKQDASNLALIKLCLPDGEFDYVCKG